MTEDAVVDIGRLITSTPGVQGGSACIAGTRVSVHEVALMHLEGASVDEIARQFFVPVSHVYAAVAYYLVNRERIDAEIGEGVEPEQPARSTQAQSFVADTSGIFRSGRSPLTARELREEAEKAFVEETAERSGTRLEP